MKTNSIDTELHKEHPGVFALVSWKSIFAGLFVALFSYLTLMALGTAVGGSAAQGIIQAGDNAGGIALSAGIWMLFSTFISLGIGSYFAARISNFINKKVGSFQGAIIASLFFALLVYGTTSTLSAVGGGIGSLASSMSVGASSLAGNPQVQSVIERSFGDDINLKSEPQVVAQGLAARLLQGNDDAAKSYLAYQTGRTRAQIDEGFTQLKTDFMATAQQVGGNVASGIATAGWIIFATLVFGMLFSVLGGSMGASANFREPLAEDVDTGRARSLDPMSI